MKGNEHFTCSCYSSGYDPDCNYCNQPRNRRTSLRLSDIARTVDRVTKPEEQPKEDRRKPKER